MKHLVSIFSKCSSKHMEFIQEEYNKKRYLEFLGLSDENELFFQNNDKKGSLIVVGNNCMLFYENLNQPAIKVSFRSVSELFTYEKNSLIYMKIMFLNSNYTIVFRNKKSATNLHNKLNKELEKEIAAIVKFGDLVFLINHYCSGSLDSFKRKCIYRLGKYFYPENNLTEDCIDLLDYKEYRFTVSMKNNNIFLESDSDYKAAKIFFDNKLKVTITLNEKKQFSNH